MMDEEIRQALNEVREMKQMCGNINMKLTNIVTQRGQDWKKKLEAEYQRGLEDGKAQREHDDKIEVGDEVNWLGDCFIVTRIYQPYGKKEQCDGIDDDGDVYRAVLIESLVKTGRHFDIQSILEAMKE